MNPVFELNLELPPGKSPGLVRRLHHQLRAAIAAGRLKPGLKLPPTRDVAMRFGISRNSAVAVYDRLAGEGFVVTRVGDGTYVARHAQLTQARRSRPAANENDPRLPPQPVGIDSTFDTEFNEPVRCDMRLGLPDISRFPFDIWRRLSTRALRTIERLPADYGDPAGLPALRRAIAGHVSFTRAVACDASEVVVTAGAQQAFDLIARTLVVPGKTRVAVEDPGYPLIRAAFAAAGAEIIAVPTDCNGLVVERMPAGIGIVAVTPSHQFPMGVAMSLGRRKALLEYASAHDAIIVEDDYDSEFRYGTRPLDALQTLDRDDSVFYVGTFSKSMFPGLRAGFVVVPGWAREALLRRKRALDACAPIAMQEALGAFIGEGHLARHVRRMRRIYAQRRVALLEAIRSHCPEVLTPVPCRAGLHQAARLPAAVDGGGLARALASRGIALEALERYTVAGPAISGIAIGFGRCNETDMELVMRRIAEQVG